MGILKKKFPTPNFTKFLNPLEKFSVLFYPYSNLSKDTPYNIEKFKKNTRPKIGFHHFISFTTRIERGSWRKGQLLERLSFSFSFSFFFFFFFPFPFSLFPFPFSFSLFLFPFSVFPFFFFPFSFFFFLFYFFSYSNLI